MPKRLKDVEVGEITLCKSPKVKSARVLLTKSDGDGDHWERHVAIKAQDEEKQIVYGYAMVPDEVDSDDDIVSVDEVEKAAHNFGRMLAMGLQKGEGVGHEHKVFSEVGYPVESVIDRDGAVSKSMGVPDGDIRPGGWWVGIKVSDEHWPLVKAGDITGFSIGGSATRMVDVEEDNSLMDVLVKACVPDRWKRKRKRLKKATEYKDLNKAMSYDEIVTVREVREQLVEKWWALMDAFWSIMDDDSVTDKVGMVMASVSQYLADIETLKTIEKSLNQTNDEGEDDMDQETAKKLVESVEKLSKSLETVPTDLEDLKKRVESLEKAKEDGAESAEETKSKDDEVSKGNENPEEPAEDHEDKVLKAIENLSDRIGKIEKASTGRKGAAAEDEESEEVNKASDDMIGTPLSFRIPS